jgi:hypothetical protein
MTGVWVSFSRHLPNWRVVQNYYSPSQETTGQKYRIGQWMRGKKNPPGWWVCLYFYSPSLNSTRIWWVGKWLSPPLAMMCNFSERKSQWGVDQGEVLLYFTRHLLIYHNHFWEHNCQVWILLAFSEWARGYPHPWLWCVMFQKESYDEVLSTKRCFYTFTNFSERKSQWGVDQGEVLPYFTRHLLIYHNQFWEHNYCLWQHEFQASTTAVTQQNTIIK